MSKKKAGACEAQYRKTVARTGKWRGKTPDKYIKYKKVKKQPRPTSKFDSFRGYMSLDRLGRPLYDLVKVDGVMTLLWAKTRRKNKNKVTS